MRTLLLLGWLCAGAAAADWLEQLSSLAQLATLQKLGALTASEHDAAAARLAGAESSAEASAQPSPAVLLAPPRPSVAGSLAQLAALQQATLLSDAEYAQAKAVLFRDENATAVTGGAAEAEDAAAGGGGVTWAELGQHTTKDDAWVAIHDDVYDFSCFFAPEPCYVHPGGTDIILEWAGKDGTEAFAAAGHKNGIAQRKGLGHLIIGRMATPGATSTAAASAGADGGCGPPYGAHPAEWAREVDGVAIGFPPGGWRTVIGRSTWHYLHSAAAKYPEHSPTPEQATGMEALVTSLGALYPCEACRYALGPELESMPPIPTATRKEVVLWWCELHNLVNIDIGHEEFSCTMEALDDIYLKNCGSCSAGAPGGGGTISISLGSLGGLGSGNDDEEDDDEDEEDYEEDYEDEGECCDEGDEDCPYDYICVDDDGDGEGEGSGEGEGVDQASEAGAGEGAAACAGEAALAKRIAELEAENRALRAAAAVGAA
jgi:FAD-linked sulfhydryl oxidase